MKDHRKIGQPQPERVAMDHSHTIHSSPSGGDTHTMMTTILKEVRDIKQSLLKIDHLQTTILSVQQSLGGLNERVEQVSTTLLQSHEQVNHHRQGRQTEEVVDNTVRNQVNETLPSSVQASRSNSKVDGSFSGAEEIKDEHKPERNRDNRDTHPVVTETSFIRRQSSTQDTRPSADRSTPVLPSGDSMQMNSPATRGLPVERSLSSTSQQETQFNGNTSVEPQPNINFDAFKIKITPRKKDNRFKYHKMSPSDLERTPSPVTPVRTEEPPVTPERTEEPQSMDDLDPVTSLQSQEEEEVVQESDQPRSMTDTVQPIQGTESEQAETESPSQEMESELGNGERDDTETPVKVTEEIATATVKPIIAAISETVEEGAENEASDGPLPKERQFLESLTLKEAQRAAECRDPKSDGADTIICIDTSESMRGAPIQQAKYFVNSFLEGVEECAVDHALEENIAIVTFGKVTAVAQHLTNDYSKIRDILEELEIEGASPIMTGLVLCMSAIYIRGGVVSFRNRKIMPRIILVSDGHVTDSRIMDGPDVAHPNGMSESEAKQQLIEFSDRLKNEHRKVTCIPVGDADMNVLENLANTTGGEIAKVEEARQLSKQFLLDTIVARVMTDEALSKPDFGRQVMETIVRDSTTGKDLTGEEIDVVFKKVMAELKENPGSRDGSGMEDGPIPVGTRVRRGRDWVWDDQDDNMAGTVIGHKQRGLVAVEWDSGRKGKYRMGSEDSFDLRSVDEPRFLPEGTLGAVGVCCRRGPDWEWENQDGGEDQIGVVFKIEDNGVIHVRWQNGKRGNYRYGIHGKFDIEMCPGRRPVQSGASSETQNSPPVKTTRTRVQWQWEVEQGSWMDHSTQASNKIEDLHVKRGRGTTLVDIDGQSYRVVIQNKKQRNTVSGVENTIRRQEIEET
ncbi:HERC2-like protein 3 [Mizuhopecten yessoensis]|uniref:HERC2-like protein 3 n=1 Tax=Mizuhopecten yessoensis TaxID=6573 RepID=A0A210QDP7_MIZYE|nr:HERC2-like protein 3 [Mizuhopecten yessoensis]